MSKEKLIGINLNGAYFPMPEDDAVEAIAETREIEWVVHLETGREDYEHLCASVKNGKWMEHNLSDGSTIRTPIKSVELDPNDYKKAFVVASCDHLSDDDYGKLKAARWGWRQ